VQRGQQAREKKETALKPVLIRPLVAVADDGYPARIDLSQVSTSSCQTLQTRKSAIKYSPFVRCTCCGCQREKKSAQAGKSRSTNYIKGSRPADAADPPS
jgi:hypothetical protein